jgi:hypothetical protein
MLLNSSGFYNLLLSFPWTTTLDMPRPVMELFIAFSRYIMACPSEALNLHFGVFPPPPMPPRRGQENAEQREGDPGSPQTFIDLILH